MRYKKKLPKNERQNRREVYKQIRDAFAEKYSFLGGDAARQLLLSAASWNIDKYSEPPFRYRNHVMLTWEPGWVKSTLIRKMRQVLGEDMVAICGKLTAAVLRGSVEAGKFSPPAPMKAPIVASTEFGQTDFNDELLNTFLALLEEGKTNVSLNKIAGLSEGAKGNAEQKYDGIKFKENNEFDLEVDFVFWGATHDPSLLAENALKDRFNVVTPAKPLTGKVTESMDKSPPIKKLISNSTVQDVRTMLKSEKQVATSFKPPSSIYQDYVLSPRESRDIQSYMACRNWWGLKVNPTVMKKFIEELKKSRRIADMSTKERVKSLIFDHPMTYSEIQKKTGLSKLELHDIFEEIDVQRAGSIDDEPEWVVRSRDKNTESEKKRFFEDLEE